MQAMLVAMDAAGLTWLKVALPVVTFSAPVPAAFLAWVLFFRCPQVALSSLSLRFLKNFLLKGNSHSTKLTYSIQLNGSCTSLYNPSPPTCKLSSSLLKENPRHLGLFFIHRDMAFHLFPSPIPISTPSMAPVMTTTLHMCAALITAWPLP